MIQDAVNYVSYVFGFLVSKVDTLFNAIPGSKGLILGVFTVLITARLLLSPLFGLSDGVISKKKYMKAQSKNSSKGGD